MEYFIGSILTILTFIIVNNLIQNKINEHIPMPLFSQSRRYHVLKSYLKYKKKHKVERQSTKNQPKGSTRGIVVGNTIYWIEDGFLVTANFVNGKPEESSKKRVDTYSMNDVELKRIVFIVDKLSEGRSDDTGNTGNKNF